MECTTEPFVDYDDYLAMVKSRDNWRTVAIFFMSMVFGILTSWWYATL